MPGALESKGETAGSLQGGLGEGSKTAASAWQQALPACLPGGQGLCLCAVPILPSGILRPMSPLPVSLRSHWLFLSVPTHSTLSQTVRLFLALGPFPEAYISLFVPVLRALPLSLLWDVCVEMPTTCTLPLHWFSLTPDSWGSQSSQGQCYENRNLAE